MTRLSLGADMRFRTIYDEVLNLDEEGVMCYLEIPKLDLNLPVYHGTSEEVLRKGVGHFGDDGTSNWKARIEERF